MDRGGRTRPHAPNWRSEIGNSIRLFVRPSPEMSVNVAGSYEEWYQEKVERQTYPGVQEGETDSEQGNYRSDNSSVLSETHDVGVQVFLDQTILAGCVPPYRV